MTLKLPEVDLWAKEVYKMLRALWGPLDKFHYPNLAFKIVLQKLTYLGQWRIQKLTKELCIVPDFNCWPGSGVAVQDQEPVF